VTQDEDPPSLLRRVKHGGRRGGSPALMRTCKSYKNMKERCSRPKHKSYARYGKRGITVCERWLHGEDGAHPFLCFVADVGLRPPGTFSLDRVDPTKNYEPGNVRWSTPKEQRANQRKIGAVTAFTNAELSSELMRRYWHEDTKPLLVRHLMWCSSRVA
jgi:hypothetical protein